MAIVLGFLVSGTAGPSELSIQARVTRIYACADVPDADFVTLPVDIAVSARNETDRTLVLARRILSAGKTRIAANAEKAKAGELEVDFTWISAGSPPGPRGILTLKPGQAADLEVGTTVFVDRLPRAPAVGAVSPGTSHVIQVEAFWDSDAVLDARRILQRQETSGELFRGTMTIPFIPLDVPREFSNLPSCEAAAAP